jgi:hypothetical protein
MSRPQILTWRPPNRDGFLGLCEERVIGLVGVGVGIGRGRRLGWTLPVVCWELWGWVNRVSVAAILLLGFYGENCASKKGTEEDGETSRKPLPIGSENPGNRGDGEDDDTGGNNSSGEGGHFLFLWL